MLNTIIVCLDKNEGMCLLGFSWMKIIMKWRVTVSCMSLEEYYVDMQYQCSFSDGFITFISGKSWGDGENI